MGLANRQAVQHSATMGLENHWVVTPLDAASRLRGSAPLKEFSFPSDAGSCGLLIGMTDGGVCPPFSKAVHPWHW